MSTERSYVLIDKDLNVTLAPGVTLVRDEGPSARFVVLDGPQGETRLGLGQVHAFDHTVDLYEAVIANTHIRGIYPADGGNRAVIVNNVITDTQDGYRPGR